MEKHQQLSGKPTQMPEKDQQATKEKASTESIWNQIAILGFGIILVSTLLVLIIAGLQSGLPSSGK